MCKCENCEEPHDGKYGSGRFCSTKCARGFSTKAKRKEINEKVRRKLYKSILKICPICESEFKTQPKKNSVCCSNSCACKLKWLDDDYRDEITSIIKERCSTLEARKRLRDIGREGGFGKKGVTNGGTKFQSKLEEKCFNYLEVNNIKFIPHRPITNSSKVSDIYLVELDLWIEIDGIDREKRKKWLGENYKYWLDKLEIYDKEGLNYVIIKSLPELKKII